MAEIKVNAQAFLFDNDGVLISSTDSANRCWRQWAKIYNVPDAENFECPHGVRALEIAKMFAPHADPYEALKVIEDLEMEDVHDIVVLPGVSRLLTMLPPERWAIVTSCTRRLFLARLKAAGLPLPERLITAESVTKGKPDPEPYRKGAELVGFDPKDCIVVEDAPSGIRAGKAAGSRVLAVVTSHKPEELTEADWVVESLEKVKVTVTDGGLELEITTL